jgi:nucleotide-binding universal stress UspA family protein
MRTKYVVAGTDGSEESLRAVEWAAREAMLRGVQLRIVSAPQLLLGMVVEGDILCESRDYALARAAQRAATVAPGLVIDTGKLSGSIAQAVTGSGVGAVMLVVGTRRFGAFGAMVHGSVSRYAATHASCPVVVVRDQPATARRQLGVAISDADTCADALAFAFEEGAVREAAVTVVHALHARHVTIRRGDGTRSETENGASTRLATILAHWRDMYPGVQVTQKVVHGHLGHTLAGLSTNADLVIIGGRPPHETDIYGPGAVTQALFNHAHGPIVTVPSSPTVTELTELTGGRPPALLPGVPAPRVCAG